MIDNGIIYIANTKIEKDLIQKLIVDNQLTLYCNTKKKKTFANDSILIACHKHYNTIQVFSSNDYLILKQIQKELIQCK